MDKWKYFCLASQGDEGSCSPNSHLSPAQFVIESPDQQIGTMRQSFITDKIDDFFQDIKQLQKGDQLYNLKQLL